MRIQELGNSYVSLYHLYPVNVIEADVYALFIASGSLMRVHLEYKPHNREFTLFTGRFRLEFKETWSPQEVFVFSSGKGPGCIFGGLAVCRAGSYKLRRDILDWGRQVMHSADLDYGSIFASGSNMFVRTEYLHSEYGVIRFKRKLPIACYLKIH
ncbi:MAG: hypothetical protein KatS3mg087_0474 [Patescibacteria group bacterium]|nr:MAG: hypothetical protein KatS3mg087_0474 [Patescibacteria group bacterium]